jgi:hypothetical protein
VTGVQTCALPIWFGPINDNAPPAGYEADINDPSDNDSNRTGSLFTPGRGRTLVAFRESLVAPLEWFTMDVIVEGNHFIIQVNGKTTADYTDAQRRFTSGHIAVQQAHPETVAEFRRIEIKELEPKAP